MANQSSFRVTFGACHVSAIEHSMKRLAQQLGCRRFLANLVSGSHMIQYVSGERTLNVLYVPTAGYRRGQSGSTRCSWELCCAESVFTPAATPRRPPERTKQGIRKPWDVPPLLYPTAFVVFPPTLLSSITEFILSIHRASMGPSNMIHCNIGGRAGVIVNVAVTISEGRRDGGTPCGARLC